MYAIMFRYDCGESCVIWNTYDTLNDALEAWPEKVKAFLQSGPDDVSYLYLLQVSDEQSEEFKQYLDCNDEDSCSSASDDCDFLNDVFSQAVQIKYEDCSGNEEVVRLAQEDGVDEDTLWSDETLYNKYLNQYVNNLK